MASLQEPNITPAATPTRTTTSSFDLSVSLLGASERGSVLSREANLSPFLPSAEVEEGDEPATGVAGTSTGAVGGRAVKGLAPGAKGLAPGAPGNGGMPAAPNGEALRGGGEAGRAGVSSAGWQ